MEGGGSPRGAAGGGNAKVARGAGLSNAGSAGVVVARDTLGGLARMTVSRGAASVAVCFLGGTVVSYVGGDGRERLFLSKDAVLDGSKPLRGGIPLVFPQFGAGPFKGMASHGFARTATWAVAREPRTTASGLVEVALSLQDDEASRKLWPHLFRLEHVVRFGDDLLETELVVENRGTVAFDFQALLHTYYRMGRIAEAHVRGLQGLHYLDQLQAKKECVEENGAIAIDKEVDRIYMGVGADKAVVVSEGERELSVTVKLAEGGEPRPAAVVLWNPWVAKSKALADFGDDEYHEMLCVEPGAVAGMSVCRPGKPWSLTQTASFRRAVPGSPKGSSVKCSTIDREVLSGAQLTARLEELRATKAKEHVLVLLSSTRVADGTRWCPDCEESDPVLEEAVRSAPPAVRLLQVELTREEWKVNPGKDHPLRKKPFNVSGIPTMLLWDAADGKATRTLGGEDLLQLDSLRTFFQGLGQRAKH